MSWLTDDPDDEEAYGEYDESDARVRPNPKGNRPRTKTRPTHEAAVPGRVLSVDRGRYTVLVGEGADPSANGGEHEITATTARELGRGAVVTGDVVDLVGDTSGDEGSLARIVRVHERRTLLRRSADDSDAVERIIVANADQMLIVVAAADPEPRERLVDRYLVAAFDVGIVPILCVTKTDLRDPADFLSAFAGLGVRVVLSRSDDPPIAELESLLVGHATVTVGHSGVGKSTLVNALTGSERAIGRVNAVTGRGRHTSSSSYSARVTDAAGATGWIIDTPGVRSFGLGHVDVAHVLGSFPDLAELAEDCPRGCTHLPDAPDCAIVEAVEAGRLGAAGVARLESFQRLLAALR
ncbi:ribosome small subunit-dependent GTPase A [Galbitalea sp. SE-J8]|uniref:ribosome small subunit-dependent GTPase A n=1 Tax=Galbitalea sp. SE-J8 TaxID=3054952 RepID=UPI00259CE9C9|nr:ribosome small subunit-dependent GTPase A [Galbitalea sp. SE-J8]MDM4764136.1 ribosome small subunit-dependent GTPase A [Galbitalea sp. SE-J8]